MTRQLRRRKHEETVRKQISEKEKQAIESRKAFFEEGARLDQEAQQRRQRLDEIKQRKLAELEVRRCHCSRPVDLPSLCPRLSLSTLLPSPRLSRPASCCCSFMFIHTPRHFLSSQALGVDSKYLGPVKRMVASSQTAH